MAGTYQAVVNLIRNAANAVNPDGTFIHGRLFQVSHESSTALPLIYLLPYTIQTGIDPNFQDAHNILIAFTNQGKPDSSPSETETTQSEMADLAQSFIESLISNTNIRLENVVTEPQFGTLQGNLSGFALKARLIISQEC